MKYVGQEELRTLKSKSNIKSVIGGVRLLIAMIVIILIVGLLIRLTCKKKERNINSYATNTIEISDIPEYSGLPYVEINSNVPYFTDDEKVNIEVFEEYSNLDFWGRCGLAYANICPEIMPTEERGEIGVIKPSGWHTVKYNDLIDGNYLYNRCHLIAFCLAGENANEKNLITGTRYLNIEGMLPFETQVASYVERTGNHVLYRVTPSYEGNNLVADGVRIEAWSIEDNGKGICFNVYCYNVQPGIEIDYKTGDSWRKGDESNNG